MPASGLASLADARVLYLTTVHGTSQRPTTDGREIKETSEPPAPHLLTHVHTTTADSHDSRGRRQCCDPLEAWPAVCRGGKAGAGSTCYGWEATAAWHESTG
jgi:hypothetical protein